jgi:hypothetical protein
MSRKFNPQYQQYQQPMQPQYQQQQQQYQQQQQFEMDYQIKENYDIMNETVKKCFNICMNKNSFKNEIIFKEEENCLKNCSFKFMKSYYGNIEMFRNTYIEISKQQFK